MRIILESTLPIINSHQRIIVLERVRLH